MSQAKGSADTVLLNPNNRIAVSWIDFNMKRMILMGDGQLDVFSSIDDLIKYVEWPDVESDDYIAFREDGVVCNLLICQNNLSKNINKTIYYKIDEDINKYDYYCNAIVNFFILNSISFCINSKHKLNNLIDVAEYNFGITK